MSEGAHARVGAPETARAAHAARAERTAARGGRAAADASHPVEASAAVVAVAAVEAASGDELTTVLMRHRHMVCARHRQAQRKDEPTDHEFRGLLPLAAAIS